MAAKSKRAVSPGLRRGLLLAIAAAGAWAAYALGLQLDTVVPGSNELKLFSAFLSRALSPALDYQASFVPAGSPSILAKAFEAARLTVVFAAVAMSLAIPAGLVLGFFASTAWWRGRASAANRASQLLVRRALAPALFTATRVLIALLRSIHELLWAVLLLSAIGLSNLSAAIAIAIPYAGMLAKVYAEIIDEVPKDAAEALEAAGAGGAQVFAFGLLPRALPDMAAYTFYRFECALRSSAIIGFFGPPTLGRFIRQSWNENYYGEVWTYLYALFALIVVVDLWSGAMRKRLAL